MTGALTRPRGSLKVRGLRRCVGCLCGKRAQGGNNVILISRKS